MQSRANKLAALIQKFRPKVKDHILQPIKIVEVGPRDGLQNEKKIVPIEDKIDLINKLSRTGLKNIEVGAFVSPKWIPQMANSKELYNKIDKVPGISYPCLVPNQKGLKEAMDAGVKEIAIFASATEGFSKANLNCSIDQSLQRYKIVTTQAQKAGIKIRGYISMVIQCPYDGKTSPTKVKHVVDKLFELGCYEVSLGDTIGKGSPQTVLNLLGQMQGFPKQSIGLHFHDTFDNALQNIAEALSLGYYIIDSSVGGLGGCPYSMKPVGNVCTENVVQLVQQLGYKTQIDYNALKEIGDQICLKFNRPNIRII